MNVVYETEIHLIPFSAITQAVKRTDGTYEVYLKASPYIVVPVEEANKFRHDYIMWLDAQSRPGT